MPTRGSAPRSRAPPRPRVAAPVSLSSPAHARLATRRTRGGRKTKGVILQIYPPGFCYPANEELTQKQPLIEELEDEQEDPQPTIDPITEEAPSDPSGE
ncbi:hypothetical protein U9M48_031655, partial [Paspalum notatum var. saurae]